MPQVKYKLAALEGTNFASEVVVNGLNSFHIWFILKIDKEKGFVGINFPTRAKFYGQLDP